MVWMVSVSVLCRILIKKNRYGTVFRKISPSQSVVWLAGGSVSSRIGRDGATQILPSEGCALRCGPKKQTNLFYYSETTGELNSVVPSWTLAHLMHQQVFQTRLGETFGLGEILVIVNRGVLVMLTNHPVKTPWLALTLMFALDFMFRISAPPPFCKRHRWLCVGPFNTNLLFHWG